MATPKKKPPKEDPEFPDLTPTEWDIEDFLEEWAPQTAVVEIYRRKDDGSMPHLRRVDISILQADLYGYLRQHFGNGRYVLQFKNEQRKIVKRLTIDVEGSEKVPVMSTQPNGGFDHVAFMREQMQMQQTLLMGLLGSMKGPDMGTLLTGLGTMLGAVKPVQSDPAAMLTAMAATFQQLKPPSEGGVKQALDLISAAKDLVPGGERSDDSWTGLIKEGVSVVANVLGSRQPAQPAQVVARPGVPPGAIPSGMVYQTTLTNPNPGPTAPETQPAQITEENPDVLLQRWITAQLSFLKTKARSGRDAADWVDYCLDNADEPGNAAILEAMRRGATFQHLLTFDPEIGKDPVLAGWFQTFYEELQAALNDPMDTGGPGGNPEDLGGNGKPSP